MNKTLARMMIVAMVAGLPGPSAFAKDNSYTYGDAALDNLTDALVVGTGSVGLAYGEDTLDKMVTTVLFDSKYPMKLTDDQVKAAIDKLRGVRFNSAGIGAWGGGELTIVYDKAHVDRVLSAQNLKRSLEEIPAEKLQQLGVSMTGGELNPGLVGDVRMGPTPSADAVKQGLDAIKKTSPSFTTEVINVRTASIEGIEQQLKAIAATGATVKYISVQGFVGRMAPRAVGTVGVAGFLMTAERLGAAVYNWMPFGKYNDSDYCSRWQGYHDRYVAVDCDKPGIAKRFFDGAAGPAYDAQQDQKERDKKGN